MCNPDHFTIQLPIRVKVWETNICIIMTLHFRPLFTLLVSLISCPSKLYRPCHAFSSLADRTSWSGNSAGK